MKIATIFLIIAAFIKLGIFPFNIWVRKIYTTVPNFFLPFYGSIASSLMLYFVIFLFYYVIRSFDIILFVSKIITPFCLATIGIFSILALKEKDLRTIFAYSTLVQSSYVLLAITTPNVASISGGILHIIHNMVCKFGLFVIICQIYSTAKSYNISTIKHLTNNKIIALCFCVLSAGLVGFPLTSGFITKFYMFQGLIEEGRFVVMAFLLFGSILSILYFWKIIQQTLFIKPQHLTNQNHITLQFSTASNVAIIISTIICIFFGIFTHFTLAKSQTLATIFLQKLS
jgi:formate hydrogenlyase subunit 3/multisubunit Na+/H+ antiporter MnhD subunit